jgi:hypothetical protein
MMLRADTNSLSWFGLRKALLPVEGDDAYITRTKVLTVGVTSTTAEGRTPSPRK